MLLMLADQFPMSNSTLTGAFGVSIIILQYAYLMLLLLARYKFLLNCEAVHYIDALCTYYSLANFTFLWSHASCRYPPKSGPAHIIAVFCFHVVPNCSASRGVSLEAEQLGTK